MLVREFPDGLGRLIGSIISNCVIVCTIMWFVGIGSEERSKARALVTSIFSQLFSQRTRAGQQATSLDDLSKPDLNTSTSLKITIPDRSD